MCLCLYEKERGSEAEVGEEIRIGLERIGNGLWDIDRELGW